jgi:outer membrane protein assembly factor BamB
MAAFTSAPIGVAYSVGRIYVGTDRGSLFCLTTGDLSDDGWLMWGANASHNGSDARRFHGSEPAPST